MNRRSRIWAFLTSGLLAGVLAAAAPGAAEAGWVGFRNETTVPVVVQIGHVTANRVQQGKPLLLHPGNVTWERVLQPGNKVITIYEPAQRRVLFQGPLLYAGNDLFFAVQPDQAPAAPPVMPPVAVTQKLKLVPTKPPAPPGVVPPPLVPPKPPGPGE